MQIVSAHQIDAESLHEHSDSDSSESEPDTDVQSLLPEILGKLNHLKLPANIFSEGSKRSRVVCAGAYGDITRTCCILPRLGKTKVAIKRLRFHLGKQLTLLFEKEIYVWSKLDHPNILPLLGFTFEERTDYPLLISEWMVNGTAWDYVKKEKCDLLQFVAGIAEGLTYLHNEGIIHSDIKPDNIVASASGVARICDFGGSRMITASNGCALPSPGPRGTQSYLAYELVEPSHPGRLVGPTKKSDVWAFGMTIYALLTQQHPYPHGEVQAIVAILKQELPVLPPSHSWNSQRLDAKNAFWNICQLCWEINPDSRSSMPMILSQLHDWVREREKGMAGMEEITKEDVEEIRTMAISRMHSQLRDVQERERESTRVNPVIDMVSSMPAIQLDVAFSSSPSEDNPGPLSPIALAAREKNLTPCSRCQEFRQGCSGGIPCKRCVWRKKTEECTPGKLFSNLQENFVHYDLDSRSQSKNPRRRNAVHLLASPTVGVNPFSSMVVPISESVSGRGDIKLGVSIVSIPVAPDSISGNDLLGQEYFTSPVNESEAGFGQGIQYPTQQGDYVQNYAIPSLWEMPVDEGAAGSSSSLTGSWDGSAYDLGTHTHASQTSPDTSVALAPLMYTAPSPMQQQYGYEPLGVAAPNNTSMHSNDYQNNCYFNQVYDQPLFGSFNQFAANNLHQFPQASSARLPPELNIPAGMSLDPSSSAEGGLIFSPSSGAVTSTPATDHQEQLQVLNTTVSNYQADFSIEAEIGAAISVDNGGDSPTGHLENPRLDRLPDVHHQVAFPNAYSYPPLAPAAPMGYNDQNFSSNFTFFNIQHPPSHGTNDQVQLSLSDGVDLLDGTCFGIDPVLLQNRSH